MTDEQKLEQQCRKLIQAGRDIQANVKYGDCRRRYEKEAEKLLRKVVKKFAATKARAVQVPVADFIKMVEKYPDATGIPTVWAEYPAAAKGAGPTNKVKK